MYPIIQVDGIIGAGKSWYLSNVLIPALEQLGFRVVIIAEPVERWSKILPLFYEDKSRWAYTFQTVAMMHRVGEVRRALQDHVRVEGDNRPVIFVSERGVTSDRMFMNILYEEGHVSDMEMELYAEWWNMWYSHIMCAPSLVIYLNTELELCQQRIVQRGRVGEITDDGQSKISIDYQAKLKQQHDLKYHNKLHTELIPWFNTKVVEITNTDRDKVEWFNETTQLIKQLFSDKLKSTQ
jgi:deoxyadenosine/deoxycytidine kinase